MTDKTPRTDTSPSTWFRKIVAGGPLKEMPLKTVSQTVLKATRTLLIAGALAATPIDSRADSSWWENVNTASWYPFNSTNSSLAGEIGMQSWQGVAGQYGRPLRSGDRFLYNGQPIKFWGFNLGWIEASLSATNYNAMAPFYAKYGVNMIRFIAFMETWSPLTQRNSFYQLDESPGGGMERFDYGMKKLKDAGIYINCSPSWHLTIKQADRIDVPYWQEFYNSYTRGAPLMVQIIPGAGATGSKTFSCDMINNGTDIAVGMRVYGIKGNFSLDLTKNTGAGVLLGEIKVSASSTNWVSNSIAVDLGDGYDYVAVLAWSEGILEKKYQYIDNVFLGSGGVNLLTDGSFSNLKNAPTITVKRLLTQADANRRWYRFDPSFWCEFPTEGYVGSYLYRYLNHPDRPYVDTEDGYGSIPGFIYFLEGFQELKIKQIENLLNHTNVYTGVKYANEPQVVVVEMHNETSIGWLNSYLLNGWMTTLRERACLQFCDWLRNKYGSHSALAAAWGAEGLAAFTTPVDNPATPWPEQGFPNQNLNNNNIPPFNLYDNGAWAQRKLDTDEFLYEVQRDYYRRFRDRICTTGYTGELIASNWSWSSGKTHYLNLNADADVGMIDRHGAYEGFNNKSLLRVPGSEFLAMGSVSQDADRPFSISEWSQSWASPFSIESCVIMAAYGLGLQGWDVATQFPGGKAPAINSVLQYDHYFNPQLAALYPFLLRMIQRGDVSEGAVVAIRPAHLPSVQNAALLSFKDVDSKEYDLGVKDAVDRMDTSVTNIHRRTPAVGKCVVDWTSAYEETDIFPIDDYRKTVGSNTYYYASNKQLTWRAGLSETDGAILVNTPGTQGAVGFFEQNEIVDLDNVKIQFLNPGVQFAAVFVTAKERGQNLANADEILVVGVARGRNTGMVYDAAGKVTNAGTSPVLMEPVKATVWLKRTGDLSVNKLDHDGFLGGAVSVDAVNKSFAINGSVDKTPYYKVTLDADRDQLPDAWEQRYFGNTLANPGDLALNGINTVLQCYIAGLNPTDPNAHLALSLTDNELRWEPSTGRLYRIFWSSNLLSGFQTMASNLTSGAYINTGTGTQAQGFYKIDVQLAP